MDENEEEFLVACASRAISKTELKYGISQKEWLAVIYGITQFSACKA